MSACALKPALNAPVVAVESPAEEVVVVDEDASAESELPEMLDAETRKKAFFKMLQPLVQAENRRIMKLRSRLLALSRKTDAYTSEDMDLIYPLAEKYRVPLSGKPDSAFWVLLLKRLDKVPVELALAQAANESAWGTSRFARDGNNYFGQWCYKEGCGIVPARRNAGSTHEVRAFASAAESVRAYIYNLNTTSAYQRLRSLRQHMRRSGEKLNASLLASGLSTYSERGAAYVKSIRNIIRHNRSLMLQ